MVGPVRFGALLNLQFYTRSPFKLSKQAFHSLKNNSCIRHQKKFVFVNKGFNNGVPFRGRPQYFSTICTPENEVESHSYEVKTFGKINIKSPFKLQVQPLKPLDYPEMNKFICEIFDHNESSSQTASEFGKIYGMDIFINENNDTVNVDIEVGEVTKLPLTCSIKIPIKYNIHIESGDDDVLVKGFEADTINVNSNKGNCYLQKLRCGDVKVISRSGNIESATLLQGNIELKTGRTGSISGDRFQGQNINCTTEHGDVNIKSLYADKTHIQSKSGTIRLGNCHGTTNIQQDSGKIIINSASGDTSGKINEGDIDVFVADCGKMYFNTDKGDVNIKLLESLSTACEFEGQSVEICNSINHDIDTSSNNSESHLKTSGSINGGSETSLLTVKSQQGKISLKQQDWISSLNLSSR